MHEGQTPGVEKMTPSRLADATEKLAGGAHLTRSEAEAAMEEILAGHAADVDIAALLSTLRAKGETVEELVGFARAMRRRAEPVFESGSAPDGPLVDTCGTGGDAKGTFNVSTAAAFAVAGAGVRVAKHGNRSISSRCGSADVLEALGVRIDLPSQRIGEAIQQVGIGFLFAPAVHTAMKHAMAARRQLGGRTVFNLLGPLTNPAGATAQVAGVFSADYSDRLAKAMGELGVRRAFVVHGADGIDEISLSGETRVAEMRDAAVHSFTVAPEDFGFERAPLDAITGGDAHQNAELVRQILAGEKGPRRDIVVMNAAAALVAAGRANDWREGARLASESLDSGAAAVKLDSLISFSTRKAW